MKLPRYSLRMLFVLVAIGSIPMGWVACQLNWIRQTPEGEKPDLSRYS